MTYYKLTVTQYANDPRSLGKMLEFLPCDAQVKVEPRKVRRYQ